MDSPPEYNSYLIAELEAEVSAVLAALESQTENLLADPYINSGMDIGVGLLGIGLGVAGIVGAAPAGVVLGVVAPLFAAFELSGGVAKLGIGLSRLSLALMDDPESPERIKSDDANLGITDNPISLLAGVTGLYLDGENAMNYGVELGKVASIGVGLYEPLSASLDLSFAGFSGVTKTALTTNWTGLAQGPDPLNNQAFPQARVRQNTQSESTETRAKILQEDSERRAQQYQQRQDAAKRREDERLRKKAEAEMAARYWRESESQKEKQRDTEHKNQLERAARLKLEIEQRLEAQKKEDALRDQQKKALEKEKEEEKKRKALAEIEEAERKEKARTAALSAAAEEERQKAANYAAASGKATSGGGRGGGGGGGGGGDGGGGDGSTTNSSKSKDVKMIGVLP